MSASTNAQPVDVLAVMDEVLARYEHGETLSPMPSGERVSESRAAVAALVEAARDYALATGSHSDEEWESLRFFYGAAPIPATRARLRAALARIGGGA